ncbi:MAG: site-specific DNA-methyltransferase [Phycisphaerae bacterium]|nr:site-specific DNA-methyltransferase [Phycisphaerae bacterium]MDD5381761.1 site-specific DNA-methyltransferase [Phycisphaerae bacterium]
MKKTKKASGKKSKVIKVDGNSLSPQKELLELLQKRFPEIFAEGKVNGDKLKQSLGEELDTNNERYGLTWAGKNECFRHIQETTTATLRISDLKSQISEDGRNSENIFIEGDNLEVLKVLQKNYYGKIKMIYIDPPYNTGNDSFIYPDRFKEEKEDYEQRAGIKDAEGLLTKDGFWRKNSKDAGHFHSNWLSMMYPRLFLARNLLREDGVIFVSIDDNEVHNLRMIMDEIFGEENFLCQMVWKKKYTGGKHSKYYVDMHEYILVYSRNAENGTKIVIDRPEDEKEKFEFSDKYEAERGKYYIRPLKSNLAERPTLVYPIKLPDGKNIKTQWLVSKDTFEQLLKEERIEFRKKMNGEYQVYKKYYERDDEGKVKVPSLIDKFPNTEAKIELKDLFHIIEGRDNIFYTVKPVNLIKYLIMPILQENDFVLDFFAGSCTTAHAVMQLNAEDGGNRKFICVQLAEPCEEESEAFKAGFKTIAEIGKERIRRVAKKIKKESGGKLDFDKGKLDLGFKVFKLEQSNFKQWQENVKTGEELKEQMKMFVDNVKKGVSGEDMLFEIILKNSRFNLNAKISKENFDGVDYYKLADGVEIVCLADKITKKLVEKITKEKPERFTCLDIAFKNNDQLKTNTALQMEAEKIEFKVI